MTDEKWRSPTGHPISSHVTDTTDFLTRGQLTKSPENVTCGDVSNVDETLKDLRRLGQFARSTDDNITFHHIGTINMLEKRIERALAQQQKRMGCE